MTVALKTVNTKKLYYALAVVMLPAAASAADVGVSLDGGTTGVGLHISTPVFDSLNARVGFGLFNFSKSISKNSVDYSAKLKIKNVDVLADWFPFENGFRLTGGGVLNFNKFHAHAKPKSGNYTFNGNTYLASQAGNIDGRIDFDRFAPYFGIGWGNAVAKSAKWGFTADLGVMFQGSPDSSLSSSGCSAGVAVCANLARDLDVENKSLRHKIDYRYWPVVRIGVFYKF